MRKFYTIIVMAVFAAAVYAGDLANFVNLGFSADGTKFAFGQYGLQDKTYRAYAEIYAVDVGANTFLPNGIFRTSPSKQTEGKESKSTFLALQNRAQVSLSKWGISETRFFMRKQKQLKEIKHYFSATSRQATNIRLCLIRHKNQKRKVHFI